MEKFDLVVQLGSQVCRREDGSYYLAPHTQMRTEAASFAITRSLTKKLLISGGSNFGVRYENQKILEKPDFSFEAFAKAGFGLKSEAEVIKDILCLVYDINPQEVFTETLSATTDENAEFVLLLLKRRPAFEGIKKVGILTLLYHMERAFPIFQEALKKDRIATKAIELAQLKARRVEWDLQFLPVFAEDILATVKPNIWIPEICRYYERPKGGKQYDVEKIRQLLTEGKSLAELMS